MSMPNPALPYPAPLYQDPYLTVELLDGGHLVRLTRSATAFPDVNTLERSYRTIGLRFDQLGRSGRCLLVDVRATVGRNDPAFELAVRRVLPLIDRGFDRVAILVQTAAGLLQGRRRSYEDDFMRLVSRDEAELLHYLRTGQSPID
jgi:hypothetical protein